MEEEFFFLKMKQLKQFFDFETLFKKIVSLSLLVETVNIVVDK